MGNTQYKCTKCGWRDEIQSYCIKCEDRKREEERIRKLADDEAKKQKKVLQEYAQKLTSYHEEMEQKKNEQVQKLNDLLNNVNQLSGTSIYLNQESFNLKDPYSEFEALQPIKLIEQIGKKVVEIGAAGEAIGNIVDHVRDKIKESLNYEYQQIFAPELEKYDHYAETLKSVPTIFVEQFEEMKNLDGIRSTLNLRLSSNPQRQQQRLKDKFSALNKKIKVVEAKITYAKMCYEEMKLNYENFINLCDNRYKQYHNNEIKKAIDEFVKQINDVRPHVKVPQYADESTHVLAGTVTGAVIGGAAAGIKVGTVMAGFVGAAAGAVIGALIGSLLYCIFGRKDVNKPMDGKKHKEALKNLGNVVAQVLENQANEWKNKKKEAKEKQAYWTNEIQRLNDLLNTTNNLSSGCDRIEQMLQGDVADYNIEDLQESFAELENNLSSIGK